MAGANLHEGRMEGSPRAADRTEFPSRVRRVPYVTGDRYRSNPLASVLTERKETSLNLGGTADFIRPKLYGLGFFLSLGC